MQQPTFTDTARCLLLAPLALALTGWTADAPLPDDDGLRCLALAQWPLAELLAARERLVALSLATALEGDS